MADQKQFELFYEITEHLLQDDVPSCYLDTLSKDPAWREYPFSLLLKLKQTEQSRKYHPEGNVWNHTMLVVDEAARVSEQSKNPKAFMWASLLHDIGKPVTTRRRKGRITSYDHDIVGADLCFRFLKELTEEEMFIKIVAGLVRYHMHMLYILKNLPYGNMENLLKKVDIFDIALLSKCDRLGRIGANLAEEEANYERYLTKLIAAKERAAYQKN
ncbi:MAG TPA: phosphohydrolase [Lachnospiraceae bacterium]|jgi:putative nucleotidyltransferase with HDIG domain|nr:phosphohydrolase [Lachnospiraceae bacterium]HCA69027.1 phosphohydrolase [Lachnospiraceae bacterium]HCR41423.1 phosphohydrolase [Lachnospiraceae bacterium]